MGKVVWMFPGQGSQYVGMGRALSERHKEVERVFERAEQALRFDLRRVMFEGPEESLKQTCHAQLAIFTLSVAVATVLDSMGLRPDMVAGHSLGEYSALVAGGAMEFEDALHLVNARASCMQDACDQYSGAMCAILGLDGETVETVCRDVKEGIVDLANFNCPQQTVISGEPDAVRAAGEEAKKRGARKAVPLAVSGAFHSRLMHAAADRFESAVASARISAPVVSFYPNVSASVTTDADEIRANLLKQICSPVRWQQSVMKMVESGADTFIEAGPGKVLAGLLKRISGSAVCLNADTPEFLDKVREHFNGANR